MVPQCEMLLHPTPDPAFDLDLDRILRKSRPGWGATGPCLAEVRAPMVAITDGIEEGGDLAVECEPVAGEDPCVEVEETLVIALDLPITRGEEHRVPLVHHITVAVRGEPGVRDCVLLPRRFPTGGAGAFRRHRSIPVAYLWP
jgi:hypothetical protein